MTKSNPEKALVIRFEARRKPIDSKFKDFLARSKSQSQEPPPSTPLQRRVAKQKAADELAAAKARTSGSDIEEVEEDGEMIIGRPALSLQASTIP